MSLEKKVRAAHATLKATEDVDARTRSLRDMVPSAHEFFQDRNEWVVSRAHCNPLRVQWLNLQPGKKSTAIERPSMLD